MSRGLIGKKIGMTRLFNEDGGSVAVTVIQVEPNRIVAVKTAEVDGYDAVQVTTGEVKQIKLSKAEAGHFIKCCAQPGLKLKEIRAEDKVILGQKLAELQAGNSLDVNNFQAGQKVDVSGVSKGKGFQGVIKRWNFSMQDATHGNSLSHRAPGSIGQRQTPGRVWKGKKMGGRMGNRKTTVQSLDLLRVDAENNLLLIRGAVPGAPGTFVEVAPSVKSKTK